MSWPYLVAGSMLLLTGAATLVWAVRWGHGLQLLRRRGVRAEATVFRKDMESPMDYRDELQPETLDQLVEERVTAAPLTQGTFFVGAFWTDQFGVERRSEERVSGEFHNSVVPGDRVAILYVPQRRSDRRPPLMCFAGDPRAGQAGLRATLSILLGACLAVAGLGVLVVGCCR